jgi:RimJ/RimL family protein N-acetyltransferase
VLGSVAVDNTSPMDFDLQPQLRGPTLSLRPMSAADLEPLWQVSSDPLVWDLHPEPSRATREGFERFFASGLASGGALIVTDNATGQVIGSSRYYDWDPERREVAIGYTFLARAYWGGTANPEMKRLMLDHAFRWADKVWFHVASSNLRSRRAMEKIGGRLTHEGQRPIQGQMVDFVYYRIDKP